MTAPRMSAEVESAWRNDEVLAAEGRSEQAELYAARAAREDAEWVPEYEPEEDPAYVAWCESQHARGALAGAPDTMGCYECGGFDGVTAPEREVVKLGPVVDRADPTQTYVLACGHTAM